MAGSASACHRLSEGMGRLGCTAARRASGARAVLARYLSHFFHSKGEEGLRRKHEVILVQVSAICLLSICFCLIIALDSVHSVAPILLGINTALSCILLEPPKPGLLAHMKSYQASAFLMLMSWHILFLEPAPPPTGFTLEPFMIACVVFTGQLMLAIRQYPMSFKLYMLVVTTVLHRFGPVFSIGTSEAILAISGNLLGILCGYAMDSDRQRLLATLQIASINRRADSRLNHVIKGHCGGANGLISALLVELEEEPDLRLLRLAQERLKEIQWMLDEAADWCHSREVFVQLESGTYITHLSKVAARSFLKAQAGTCSTVTSIDAVMVDHNLFRLLVHEGLSNAKKYCEPGTLIGVNASLEEDGSSTMLHVSITNEPRKGARQLTKSECAQAFVSRTKRIDPVSDARTTRSDGVGLASVKLAVHTVGGTAWLHADKKFTTLHIKLPAARCIPEDGAPDDFCVLPICGGAAIASSITALPAPSERPCATKTTEGNERTPPKSVAPPNASLAMATYSISKETLSQSEMLVSKQCEELVLAVADSTRTAEAADANASDSSRPVCIGIDDSLMLRRMQADLFRVFLKADENRSISIGGAVDEVEAFVDVVMGRRCRMLKPAKLPPADIAVLDENIDVEECDITVRGSDLARNLRDEGFEGVICILTGSNRNVVEELLNLAHVDLAFEKGGNLKSIADALSRAHAERKQKPKMARMANTSCEHLL